MTFIKECLNGHSRKSKIVNCISFSTIGVAMILLLTYFYWKLYPYNPLVINHRPLELVEIVDGVAVPIENSVYGEKDVLIYQLDYCKYTDKGVTIKRKFRDGIDFAIPDYFTRTNPAGCRVQNFGLDIPDSLPEGEYILTIEFEYQMNPIRQVTVRTHTVQFKVI